MFKKILVAVNNSEIGHHVFEQALSLAKLTNAELMILQVISPFNDEFLKTSTTEIHSRYTSSQSQNVEYYLGEWDKLKQQGVEFLTLLTNQAIAKGIAAEFTQELGDPGRMICEVAKNYHVDVIVIGRRGLSGIGELFLGSVSNYVLHHAPCSVLTVLNYA
ncbi:universal stress protein UspA [Nostoc sp. MBR 210]|uniref:Universal stress protein n=1 Tax=Nostoc spongiaeforme FACHB-130 TaxID=1357510 RepID=A0ABR8FPU5_9NOSO|nr:universal stress protein [Nostoc spongiaeforme]MBD2593073.1 universal stress protein [Nostoc spongiaeforme FACHB-130]OCQ99845.1 universal stress protein UspA [Nostoc sp. MBR 210]